MGLAVKCLGLNGSSVALDQGPVPQWSLRRDLLLRLRHLEIDSVKLFTQSQDFWA